MSDQVVHKSNTYRGCPVTACQPKDPRPETWRVTNRWYYVTCPACKATNGGTNP